MKKFKGEINGQQYTDQKEFEKAYRDLLENGYNGGSLHVQYSIEESEDSKKVQTCENVRPQLRPSTDSEKRADEIEYNLTESERDDMCSSLDTIKMLVEDASKSIQENVDSDNLDKNSVHEFSQILDATINKIRWTVDRLPSDLRFLLCHSLRNTTEKMVDNIESELVDRSYEEAKEQVNITDERQDIEDEIKDIDDQINDLEKDKQELFKEMGRLCKDYDTSECRVQVIKSASKFYKELLDVFEY